MPSYKIREHVSLKMSDGVSLSARLWIPEGNPSGLVIEYIPYRKEDAYRAMDEFWEDVLASRGIGFTRLDVLGSGESQGVILDLHILSNEPELENHDTDPGSRFKLMRERVELMKALWTEEVASYEGDLVSVTPNWQWPKPVQSPHPPVFVAGASPRVIDRVARYGDGWLPVVIPEANEISPGRMTPLKDLEEMIPRMNELAEAQGRDRPRVIVSGHYDRVALATYETLQVASVSFHVPLESFDRVRRT